MQDKLNQWTEKVQVKRNDFKQAELTTISWKCSRIVIPVQSDGSKKCASEAIERRDQ